VRGPRAHSPRWRLAGGRQKKVLVNTLASRSAPRRDCDGRVLARDLSDSQVDVRKINNTRAYASSQHMPYAAVALVAVPARNRVPPSNAISRQAAT
jgi:hypothetical protein